MNKLNITRGKVELSDQDISKHKDFDALLRSYKMVHIPFYKSRRFIIAASVASAAAVVTMLYFTVFQNSGQKMNPVLPPETNMLVSAHSVLPDHISPPFASLEVNPESFFVDALKGAQITNKNGSSIHVPAKAFKDQQGRTVAGKVELRYREFRNPVELFLSGVPTHYDTAGQTFHFQSGGMMEITAYQDNQPVLLDTGKEIEVEMNSYFPGQYKLYYFDTVKNQWIYNGYNEPVTARNDALPAVIQEDPGPDTFVMPVLPRKADRKKDQFNINVDYSKFPELAEYKNVAWEVDESFRVFDKRIYNVVWETVALQPSETPQNYYITVSRNDSNVTVRTYPVFKNKDYEQALKLYNEKLVAYNSELEKHSKKNAGSVNRLGDASGRSTINGRVNYAELKPTGKRRIALRHLGFYSCDIPILPPAGPGIHPVFADPKGGIIHNARVFVADCGRNVLYNFGQATEIPVDKKSAKLFWIVTPEGGMGVLSPETFAALTRDDDKPVFRFDITDAATGVHLLKEYLNI